VYLKLFTFLCGSAGGHQEGEKQSDQHGFRAAGEENKAGNDLKTLQPLDCARGVVSPPHGTRPRLLQPLWDVIGAFHEKQPGVVGPWGAAMLAYVSPRDREQERCGSLRSRLVQLTFAFVKHCKPFFVSH